ncbi:MAG: leucine-rich repeat domain-containing protein [Clostridia bacterium]|nr:leucine-rich repeat domain-containing protein [Clostridia bacterium]
MKKFIALFVALLLTVSLCACGDTSDETTDDVQTTVSNNNADDSADGNKGGIKTESKDEDFYAEDTDKGYYITDYVGDAQIIRIPETLNGKTVEGISYSTFFNVQMEEVYFPSTITEIEARTFENQLVLKKVVLNEGIKTIGDDAFINCYELTEINIPSTVETLGICSFACCEKLSSIELPEGLKSIGQSCLGDTALISVTIPASVAYLGLQTVNSSDSLKDMYVLNPNAEFDPSAITECPNVVLHGAAGSTAETYALENDIPFVAE